MHSLASDERLRCTVCGGEVSLYSTGEYPGGGFFQCYQCDACGERGWQAVYLNGTIETGGCIEP